MVVMATALLQSDKRRSWHKRWRVPGSAKADRGPQLELLGAISLRHCNSHVSYWFRVSVDTIALDVCEMLRSIEVGGGGVPGFHLL